MTPGSRIVKRSINIGLFGIGLSGTWALGLLGPLKIWGPRAGLLGPLKIWGPQARLLGPLMGIWALGTGGHLGPVGTWDLWALRNSGHLGHLGPLGSWDLWALATSGHLRPLGTLGSWARLYLDGALCLEHLIGKAAT
jgi:hypothetical protein